MKIDIDDKDDIAVDMAPLIDCVFLLLIFFLVATVMKKPEMKLPITLPEPAISGIEIPAGKSQKIGIDKTGLFYFEGNPITQKELYQKLKELSDINPSTELLIDVDRDAPTRFLVQVIDLCSFHGLKNYSIHTQGSQFQDRFLSKKEKK